MAKKPVAKQNTSSPMSILVGYQALGFDHLLRNLEEVKKNSQKLTEANIDEILNDGAITTQKISKVA